MRENAPIFFPSRYIFWTISRYTDSTRCQLQENEAKRMDFVLQVRAKRKIKQNKMNIISIQQNNIHWVIGIERKSSLMDKTNLLFEICYNIYFWRNVQNYNLYVNLYHTKGNCKGSIDYTILWFEVLRKFISSMKHT